MDRLAQDCPGCFFCHRVDNQFSALRCLLVEDCEFDRAQVLRLLRESGVSLTVSSVSTLDEARTMLASEDFDFVLCDRWLTDGDGLEIVAALRDDAVRNADAPVFLVTGDDRPELERQARASGAAAVLDKNRLDPAMLCCIARSLEQARSGARLSAEQPGFQLEDRVVRLS